MQYAKLEYYRCPSQPTRLLPQPPGHDTAEQFHRALQIADKAWLDQPEIDQRLEVRHVDDVQLITVLAVVQQRLGHQPQTQAIGDQPKLQFGTEGFQVQLKRQPLLGQRPLQPGTKAAAVGVQHPALGVTVGQLALLALDTAPGRDDQQLHSRQGLALDTLGKHLAGRKQRTTGVQLADFDLAQQRAAPAV